MRTTLKVLAAVIAIGVVAGVASAGSIWAKATANAKAQALYSDDKAAKLGDSLTIVINERGVIKNETKRNLDKKSSRSAKITGKQDILNTADAATGRLFSLTDPLDVSVNAQSSFEGDAKFDSDRSVTDQITVTVSDVLPNGNLVVTGSRTREMEGDKQVVQVSGIVRPSDVSFANTIASEKVADFKVVYKHGGMENSVTKPGWLDQILNWISPF